MHQGTADRLGVRPGALEGPPHARLDGAAGDPIPIAANEQRSIGGPSGKAPSCRRFGCGGEAACPAVEVVFDDRQQVGLDRNAAVLAAFATDPNDRTVAGRRADVTDIGATQFVGAQAREQTGENQRYIPFGPVGAPCGLAVAVNRLQECGDRGLGQCAGECLGRLGPPDERHGIGRDEFGGIEEVAQHIPG